MKATFNTLMTGMKSANAKDIDMKTPLTQLCNGLDGKKDDAFFKIL